MTVVVTADRAVPGSRVAAAVGTRVVLPLPDRADYAVAGVAARAVPGHRPPGRALLGEDAVECQLAVPREPGPPSVDWPGEPTAAPPIRVTTLPADPELPLCAPGTRASGCWLPIGPGGDDGATIGVDLQRTGGLLVVGPPGSGRSSALRAFAEHLGSTGAAVAALTAAPRRPRDQDRTPPDGSVELDRADADALRAWLTSHDGGQEADPSRPVVVVADDVTSLPDAVADVLGSAVVPGRPVLVLAAGTAADLAGSFRGPAVALRRSRTALVLRPTPGDAELLGLRTPRTPLPARPGAGWLVSPGQVVRVQAARRRRPPGRTD